LGDQLAQLRVEPGDGILGVPTDLVLVFLQPEST